MQTEGSADSVTRQRDDLPGNYGNVDFTIVPERLDHEAAVDDERFAPMRDAARRVFDRPDLLETMRNATMTGTSSAEEHTTVITQVARTDRPTTTY